jgi:hypothetical protein
MSGIFEMLLFLSGTLLALWLFPLWFVLTSIALFLAFGAIGYIRRRKSGR